MIFKNRDEAARLLLPHLSQYRGKNPLVLGIPRGGMGMARVIAEGLQGELGAVLVHKLSAPENPEYAIGSVGLSGAIYRSPATEHMDLPESYLQSEVQRQLRLLRRRYEEYGLTPVSYRGRIVIIVDDGIATGATLIGAIHEVRLQKPDQVIVAAPVASWQSAEQMRSLIDNLVLLLEPDNFSSVSEFYADFSPVTDEQVLALLTPKQQQVDDVPAKDKNRSIGM